MRHFTQTMSCYQEAVKVISFFVFLNIIDSKENIIKSIFRFSEYNNDSATSVGARNSHRVSSPTNQLQMTGDLLLTSRSIPSKDALNRSPIQGLTYNSSHGKR